MKPFRNDFARRSWSWAMLLLLIWSSFAGGGAALAADAPSQANEPMVQVTGGQGFSVALKADGTVWAWGDNLRGKLGTAGGNRFVPSQVEGLTGITALAAGLNHTLALKKDGTVWAWGQNDSGQLGDGTQTDRMTPFQIKGLENIVSIAAGNSHSVALKKDGTVWTWGANDRGQLGDGTTTGRNVPAMIPNLQYIKAIASGANHVLAIWNSPYDGYKNQVCVWGAASYGTQMNQYSTGYLTVPYFIPYFTDAVEIAAGNGFSLALNDMGYLYAWGTNFAGQLGDGSYNDKSTLSNSISLPKVKKIAAGNSHAMALTRDNELYVWGSNGLGQLGTKEVEKYSVPMEMESLGKVEAFGTGRFHSFAVKEDGSLWTWGNNTLGQLGDGTTTDRYKPQQVGDFNVKAAAAPPSKGDEGPKTDSYSMADVALSAGESFTMVRNNGQLWAFGENTFGQLGLDKGNYRNKPSALSSLKEVKQVAAGYGHTAVLKSDGTVWTWGNNIYGQLGDGTTDGRREPAPIPGLSEAAAVAVGNSFTIVLKADGTVWGAGDNSFGQLANGQVMGEKSLIRIPGLSNIQAIAAGYNHALALSSDGKVWAWGDNTGGQLGNGKGDAVRYAVPVNRLSDVKAIAAGRTHSLALKKDGTVWAWGYNTYGQLGDGTSTLRKEPVILELNHVAAIAAGGYHSLALRQDGSLWAWGSNTQGQLGDGSNTSSVKQVKVAIPGAIASIAAGGSHSAAMLQDGSVWTWGSNINGQLGDGSFKNSTTPTAVGGFSPLFGDLAGHWAEKAIAAAAGKGYVDGYEDGSFRPELPVTRAEFAKLTAVALKLPTSAPSAGQSWSVPYIDALLAAGVYGQEDVQAAWDEPMTRAEMARVAVRAAIKELQSPQAVVQTAWALQNAVKLGLLQGLSGGRLAPEERTTRAQSIVIIERMLTVAAGGTLEPDAEAVRQAEAL
ncbi:RCC1 domain-containing protein [Paenibacillus silviterrae]|uniref:RCC1 domain-containing protein n=1 Tax=Paenibacillus silviterrae TaxID=3242194 RepID=UPI00254366E2|nr:S-layer homology domain-containing protein [Paenibacillus chinjuensis]